MRYIDISKFSPSEEWKLNAARALADIQQLPREERAKGIEAHSSVWQSLKEDLSKLSHDKCWYCESKRQRSDGCVDHFRPKGRVAGCPEHEGYWWLAFEWRNYRFSCTYCNSKRVDRKARKTGGKQDYFPLLNEANRAHDVSDSLECEVPCLLDPTELTDPSLLFFQEDGMATSASPDQPRLRKRAGESIKLYHLNLTDTVERRALLYRQIKRWVDDGTRYFEKYAQGDNTVTHAFKRVLETLREVISPEAEYSVAAKSYLMGLRSERGEWLVQLLAVA